MSRSTKTLTTVPRAPSLVHSFRRAWNVNIYYNASTGWFAAGQDMTFSFSLSVSDLRISGTTVLGPNLPAYAEITDLFDDYRIKKVTLRFDWSQDGYPGSSPTLMAPLIYYVQDFNDASTTNLTNLLQYPEVKNHSFYSGGYKPLIVELRPRPLMDIASTGITTAYGPTLAAPWIRTSEPGVPHYGFKLAANNFGVATNATVGNVSLTAYIDFECRGVR